jgi:hypothetical protein
VYKSPEWRQRKKDFFNKYKKVCACCGRGSNEVQIQLHHLDYDHPVGSEPDDSLAPLCADHHIEIHQFYSKHFDDFIDLEEATMVYLRLMECGHDPLRRPKKLSQRRKGKGKTIKRRRRTKDPYSNYAKSSRSRKLRKRRRVIKVF